MKNILFTLLLLGLYGTTIAQEAMPPSPTAMVKPEVTLPSVDAFALTKFGDIPINEYSGMVNASIPLYTLQSGHLSLPISLNYNAVGVKVAQAATWTGMNWTLSAGGVITRTVHDKPDEADFLDGRISAEMIIPAGLINGSSHAAWLNRVFSFHRSSWDVKPDQFYFNFPGYSGSFFFDMDFVPHLTKADSNLKIEIVGTDSNLLNRFRLSQEFCLTTPDGIKYYFGGPNGTETTFVGSRMENPYVPTAYYLTRIYHPESGIITFEYDTDTVNRTINLDKSESITLKTWEWDTRESQCILPAYTDFDHSINTTSSITANGKTLKKIIGNFGNTEVTLNASNGSPLNFRKVLNSIAVKEGSTIINTINFTYLFSQWPTLSERFFLTNVEFNKNNNYGSGRKYEKYTLEYDDPLGLPSRTSSARDVLGYYNGKTNNSTFLPQNTDIHFHSYYPNLADKSSDVNAATKGALKKMTFPTGGYTLFEYEMGQSKEYTTDGITMNVWRNNPNRNPINKTTTNSSINGDSYQNPDGTFGFTGAFRDETIKGIANIYANDQMGHTDVITLKITDIYDNTVQQFAFRMPDGNQQLGTGTFNFSVEFSFDIKKGHEYAIQLYNNYQFSNTKFDAEVYFVYSKGTRLIDDGPLRVKRVTDFTAETQNAFVKRYYYVSPEDYFKNPLSLVTFRKNYDFVSEWQLTKCCNNGSGEPGEALEQKFQREINFKTFSSEPMIPISELEEKYEHVIISYGGDNFELGGKYKRFYNAPLDFNIDILPFEQNVFQQERASYKGNASESYHGTLLEEVDLVKRGAAFYKVKQQLFEYQYNDLAAVSGVIGGYNFFNCLYRSSGVIPNFDLRKYYLTSRRVELLRAKTFDFTTPVLYNVDPETNPAGSIKTLKSYSYFSLIGLPTTVQTTTSEDNTTSHVNYTYANQTHLVPNATPTQIAALNKLVELNKVSEPVVVRTFRGPTNGIPTQTGTKVTLYKNWNNNVNWILPELIRFSKGTDPLEDRILIEQYDLFGNMNRVKMVDGTRTYYLYNGRNQLVLKIENFIPTNAESNDEVVALPEITPGGPCTLSQTYPKSIVTRFYYDTTTQLLTRTVDTNCRNTYYEYDSLMRLKRVKDHDGNVIEEYDNNYRTN